MYGINIIWRWIRYEYCENDGRFHDKKHWNVSKWAQEICKLNVFINQNWIKKHDEFDDLYGKAIMITIDVGIEIDIKR